MPYALFPMDYALCEGIAGFAEGSNVLLQGISHHSDRCDPRPRDYAPCPLPSFCEMSTLHRPLEAVAASLVLRGGRC